MLNLFNLLPKKTKIKKYNDNNNLKYYKHYPSSIREWKNSIYVFNKNSEKSVPSSSNLAFKLIKSYFNLYNKRLEFKMRTKRLLLRLRRLSSNRFYVSNGGFKHTNNKVYINLYVFNRQKKNYLLTLKKWFLKRIVTKKYKASLVRKTRKHWTVWKLWRKRKINLFKTKKRKFKNKKVKNIRKRISVNKKIIKRVKEINNKGLEKLELLNSNYHLIKETLNKTNKYNINNYKSFVNYTENFYKNLIKKSLRKVRMYFYYKQLVLLNKSKLSYTYLQHLKKYLENVFNKNVEFNIINLRRFYLNSDILSESMSIKLARNRRKMFKYLTRLKDKVVVKKKRAISFDKPKQNLTMRLELTNNDLKLRKYILQNLKYKDVTGFRLEAKGRLSKRFTASRSVSKLKYKGNLLELDSSNKGWSSVLLKGNLRSNTQFTKIKSKSRIGSFGIKGWVSGN